jgi:hypothetical protein
MKLLLPPQTWQAVDRLRLEQQRYETVRMQRLQRLYARIAATGCANRPSLARWLWKVSWL